MTGSSGLAADQARPAWGRQAPGRPPRKWRRVKHCDALVCFGRQRSDTSEDAKIPLPAACRRRRGGGPSWRGCFPSAATRSNSSAIRRALRSRVNRSSKISRPRAPMHARPAPSSAKFRIASPDRRVSQVAPGTRTRHPGRPRGSPAGPMRRSANQAPSPRSGTRPAPRKATGTRTRPPPRGPPGVVAMTEEPNSPFGPMVAARSSRLSEALPLTSGDEQPRFGIVATRVRHRLQQMPLALLELLSPQRREHDVVGRQTQESRATSSARIGRVRPTAGVADRARSR